MGKENLMWPFSKIETLKQELEEKKKLLVSAREALAMLQLANIKYKQSLAESQKNDTPKDLKTGKFKKSK
jgi:regulator of replication initiation timing